MRGWCEFEMSSSHNSARIASMLEEDLQLRLLSENHPDFDEANSGGWI
jgi:hypothetical protein